MFSEKTSSFGKRFADTGSLLRNIFDQNEEELIDTHIECNLNELFQSTSQSTHQFVPYDSRDCYETLGEKRYLCRIILRHTHFWSQKHADIAFDLECLLSSHIFRNADYENAGGSRLFSLPEINFRLIQREPNEIVTNILNKLRELQGVCPAEVETCSFPAGLFACWCVWCVISDCCSPHHTALRHCVQS